MKIICVPASSAQVVLTALCRRHVVLTHDRVVPLDPSIDKVIAAFTELIGKYACGSAF